MRHVSLLLVLLLLTALLLVGCTDNDTEQSTDPVQASNSIPVNSGGEPAPNTTAPIPTELETQEEVVIDVTGQPVVGG